MTTRNLEIDDRCPEKWSLKLYGLADQAAKGHWMNVTFRIIKDLLPYAAEQHASGYHRSVDDRHDRHTSFNDDCEVCLREENVKLKLRQTELLQTVRNLSMESINDDEATEMRTQMSSLIAEVGTLRSEISEVKRTAKAAPARRTSATGKKA